MQRIQLFLGQIRNLHIFRNAERTYKTSISKIAFLLLGKGIGKNFIGVKALTFRNDMRKSNFVFKEQPKKRLGKDFFYY